VVLSFINIPSHIIDHLPMTKEAIIPEVIQILVKLDRGGVTITPQTLILSELDFDSLQMMNLLETLIDRYGADFLAEPYSLQDLRTPETLAEALCRVQSSRQ
jgi:acyl carrier protein